MWADLQALQHHFTAYVGEHGSRGPAGRVAMWLAAGDLDPAGFAEIVEREGCSREEWFRKQMLDLVLDFTSPAEHGELLTPQIINTANVLKRAVHVREGDFLRWRPVEVSRLIVSQLEILLEDGTLTDEEDLYCVELQALFDLSLDAYFRLARPAFERAWERLMGRVEDPSSSVNSRLHAFRNAERLEPLYNLSQAQARSLGALY